MVQNKFIATRIKRFFRVGILALVLFFGTVVSQAEPPGSPKGEKNTTGAVFDQNAEDHNLRTPLLSGLMVLVLGIGGLMLFKLFIGQTGGNKRRNR